MLFPGLGEYLTVYLTLYFAVFYSLLRYFVQEQNVVLPKWSTLVTVPGVPGSPISPLAAVSEVPQVRGKPLCKILSNIVKYTVIYSVHAHPYLAGRGVCIDAPPCKIHTV